MNDYWPMAFSPAVVREGFGSSKLSSFTIALEAWRRNLTVELFDPAMTQYKISDGSTDITFNFACPVSITPRTARENLRDKWATKKLLETAGVPVPSGVVLDSQSTQSQELSEAATQVGYPLTIKPLSGSKGQGVFTGIRSWDELERTYSHLVASMDPGDVLIEEHVSGDDYRLLVLGDQVLAACKRVPANVTGDGHKTVEGLIAEKNKTRRQNPFLSRGLINPDFEVTEVLQDQGASLSTVPAPGQKITLRRVANASAGGDVIDVTSTIPDEVRDAAVDAVAATPGIVIAGVDFLYSPAAAGYPAKFSIIEMNYRPHIGVNMYPTEGQGQDVPRQMIDYFFPSSKPATGAGESTLVFNLRLLKESFSNASTVSIPALPHHRYPVRKRVRILSEDAAVTQEAADQITKQCRSLDVCGYLTRNKGHYTLIVGGEETQVSTAISIIVKAVGHSTNEAINWRGRLQAGFQVKANAIHQSSTSPDALASTPSEPVRVSLVGDVLIHSNLLEISQTGATYSFSKQFEDLGPELSRAHIASANLESIAAGPYYGLSGFPKFNAPQEILDDLKNAGFTTLSVANNHMLDKGEEALLSSMQEARHRGFDVTGASPTSEEFSGGIIRTSHGVRVGFVSFTDGAKLNPQSTQNVNINRFPGENSGSRMVRRIAPIRKQLNAMTRRADIVVLQLHFGEEYHKSPSAFQRELVTSLAELNVDVIVGHHPHVLQPIEWIENSKGKRVLVAYSLGNYLSGQRGVHRQIGGILSFSVNLQTDENRHTIGVSNPELLLTYVDDDDDFKIKKLSGMKELKPVLSSPGGITVNSSRVYEDSIKRLNSSGATDIQIH